MSHIQSTIFSLLLLTAMGCTPIVHAGFSPKSDGVSTSAECEKAGEEILVKFALAPAEDNSKCSANFSDGQPKDLSIVAQNGMVRLKWRLSKSQIEKHRYSPYRFTLLIDDHMFQVGLTFETTRDLIAPPIIKCLISL